MNGGVLGAAAGGKVEERLHFTGSLGVSQHDLLITRTFLLGFGLFSVSAPAWSPAGASPGSPGRAGLEMLTPGSAVKSGPATSR